MKFRILATAAIATCMAVGGAMAQNSGEEGPSYVSEQEQAMYQDHAEMMAPFFQDETMTELKSDEDMASAYEGMSAEDQDMLRENCDRAQQNRGAYGPTTLALCEKMSAM